MSSFNTVSIPTLSISVDNLDEEESPFESLINTMAILSVQEQGQGQGRKRKILSEHNMEPPLKKTCQFPTCRGIRRGQLKELRFVFPMT
jgi:hypothetical protein